MKQELQEELFEKYPKIFRQKDLSMQETAMCWGIETGDGWFNIVDMLCCQIQWHIEHNLKKDEAGEDIQVEATQIKEKFGTLRFYYHGGNEFIRGLVSMAEGISGRICEDCGAPGTQNSKGWIRTQCEPCKEKQNLRWEKGTQGGTG